MSIVIKESELESGLPKTTTSLCPECKANPRNIFPNLEIVMKKNPKEFINVFKKAISQIPKEDSAKMCPECKSVCAEELEFAFSTYMEMVATVMRYGFNINVDMGGR